MAREVSKADLVLKQFWEKNEHFADVFNAVLFGGEEILKPELLQESSVDISSVIKFKQGEKSLERIRDVVKKSMWGLDWIILGIENQMRTHYGMPLRTMLYDGLNYLKQYEELEQENRKEKRLRTSEEFLSGLQKRDRIYPVITLVIYYGEEPWDGPITLTEMMTLPDGLRPFIFDYGINLLEVRTSGKYHFKNKDVEAVFSISRNIYNKNYDIIKQTYGKEKLHTELARVIGTITSTTFLERYVDNQEGEEIIQGA